MYLTCWMQGCIRDQLTKSFFFWDSKFPIIINILIIVVRVEAVKGGVPNLLGVRMH